MTICTNFHQIIYKVILIYFLGELQLKTEQDYDVENMEVDPLALPGDAYNDTANDTTTPRIVSVESVASFITNNNNNTNGEGMLLF